MGRDNMEFNRMVTAKLHGMETPLNCPDSWDDRSDDQQALSAELGHTKAIYIRVKNGKYISIIYYNYVRYK